MPPSVLTIGNFDGVHVGHAALVERARAAAAGSGGAEVVAMVFDPHPLTTLRPGDAPARLSTFAQREAWLRGLGADRVVRLEPTREFLSLSAQAFVESVAREYPVRAIVEGQDFHFGRGRGGNVAVLADLGRSLGFAVHVVEPVTAVLDDHAIVRASSSIARWLLSNGRVRDAAVVLGRPYELAGVVVRGDRRGRTIGFPTANLATDCLAPADGVYAATAHLDDGRVFAAAVSVGTKPTFGEHERAVEAYLLDATDGSVPPRNGDSAALIPGMPEYGWNLRIRFTGWVRDQMRFGSVADLVEQMDRDCARVRALTAPAPQEAACP